MKSSDIDHPVLVEEHLDLAPLEGTTTISVAGESHYQDALSEICGGKTVDGHHLAVTATLVPEPANPYDPNAIAVHVSGLMVGHLPRQEAATLHGDLVRLSAERPVTCRARIRGGWLRPDGDEGFFGIDLFFRPKGLSFSEPPAEIQIGSAAEAPIADGREPTQRRSPDGPYPDGTYQGRHYTDWVSTVEGLKRNGSMVQAAEVLLHLLDAVEDEAAHQHWGVAPWYYEQLAIIMRKQKDFAGEVAVLERFAAADHGPGVSPPILLVRLEKARLLLARAPNPASPDA